MPYIIKNLVWHSAIIGNVLGVEMSTVMTGAGGLLWHAHVSELSDNDKAAIMQILTQYENMHLKNTPTRHIFMKH